MHARSSLRPLLQRPGGRQTYLDRVHGLQLYRCGRRRWHGSRAVHRQMRRRHGAVWRAAKHRRLHAHHCSHVGSGLHHTAAASHGQWVKACLATRGGVLCRQPPWHRRRLVSTSFKSTSAPCQFISKGWPGETAPKERPSRKKQLQRGHRVGWAAATPARAHTCSPSMPSVCTCMSMSALMARSCARRSVRRCLQGATTVVNGTGPGRRAASSTEGSGRGQKKSGVPEPQKAAPLPAPGVEPDGAIRVGARRRLGPPHLLHGGRAACAGM